METLIRFSVNFLLFIVIGSCHESPRIDTPSGRIEGVLDESVNGNSFFSFEGIPYAEPPVGKLRFKEPVPAKSWKGIWKADTKYECIQYNHFAINKNDPVDGTEDCLYLNVYTPKIDGNSDVIVFIHGGAFIFGAGHYYQPHILMDRNVVFVTINYRLGPLGFLSTEDDEVPGNNGLKDQVLALKWIKENIQYFGGNSDSITITGMSAGGASVHFHLLNPESKGLFHKAISMSGCMLNPWVLMENPLEKSRKLATHVGCNTDDIERMVDCLRKRPAKQVVGVVGKFQPFMFNPFSPFGVVVDEWANDPVLPKHPIILMHMNKKRVNNIPWIVSHTADEGLYNGEDYYNDTILKYINDHWNEVIPHILDYNYTVPQEKLDEISDVIRQKYFGNEILTRKSFYKLIDLMGDRIFKSDLDKCARYQSAAMEFPVWYYEFNYRGAHSWTEIIRGLPDNIGVSHGDDTNYVIKTPVDTLSTDDDRTMSKIMVDLFVSFAQHGESGIDNDWVSVSKKTTDQINYLKIDSPFSLRIEKTDEFGNKKFWNGLPFNENERLLENSIKDEL